ncbi:MAG: hypothetical protein JXA99_04445 [Candidatus Lokiarchaeota archaeon]|nr:hypothetical protein [Candidatus Lokiarchaeota archaeon]
MMNKDNFNNLFIIQEIGNFPTIIKRKDELLREIEEERSYNLLSRENFSIKDLDNLNKYIKINNLEKKEIFEDLTESESEFIGFILKDRIKKELRIKIRIDLGKYHIFIFPECPSNLVYRSFLLLTSDLETFEKDLIDYLGFKEKTKDFTFLQTKKIIHLYMKIKNENEIIDKFLNTFASKERFQNIIILNNKLSKDSRRILIGEKTNYLSSIGNIFDLDYILNIKEYLRRFI